MSATTPTPSPDAEPASRPPVDEGFAPMLAFLASPDAAPLSSLTPDQARETFRALRGSEGEPVPMRSITDAVVPGPAGDVPVRIAVPEADTLTGVLIWFHGGGWVIGDLDTAEDTQRRLADLASCVVVSVHYRLAPEHPSPAGFDDCWAVTTWVAEHRDELGVPGGRLAVAGDSAGGNLAALVALRAAAAGGPDLALQALVYPVTDCTMASPSYEENGVGYFLTADTMRWFTEANLAGGADPTDPSVSPLFASPEAMAGVAPALVQVAGYDPLRDEGRAYGEKLAAAGVPVEVVEYPTMIHGFLAMSAFTPVSDEAAARLAEALRTAFTA